jgi:site-specific DNA-methyltransferase (adenine-specific)
MEINKIYNENCLETMAKMSDNFIDLTVTSPPYDDLRTYNGYSFPFEEIAKELYRVTKQGGVVVWVIADQTKNGSESGTSFKQALFFKEIGFNIHDTMIYKKKRIVPLTHNRYEQGFEYMFVFSKVKPKTFNPIMIDCIYAGTETWGKPSFHKTNSSGLVSVDKKKINDKKQKDNVWEFLNAKDNVYKHPAPFPEQLANDHILSWSNENDLIYDCFMGSGTTAKMSILNNRNFIGSELSKEYCEIALKRIEGCTNQTKLF